MKVIISRTYQETETLGTLIAMNGYKRLFECKTIELPWKNNQRNISCIPEGTYIVEKTNAYPKKGRCFHILNVKDRDDILIHKGNFASSLTPEGKIDTKGCILSGLYFLDINGDGLMDVAESTKAMDKLLDVLPDTFKLIII